MNRLTREGVLVAARVIEAVKLRGEAIVLSIAPGLVELLNHLGYTTVMEAERMLVYSE